jgi:D-glycerate 3-kinase
LSGSPTSDRRAFHPCGDLFGVLRASAPILPSKYTPGTSRLLVKNFLNLETLWNLWLPLAMQLSTEKQSLNRPLIQGILGGQGTGKTTLCQVLRLILGKLGYSTVSLSLDDLYKTYADRQQLQKADPRLIWRGPPGTHDIDLGISVLDKLRRSQTRELAAVDIPNLMP